MSDFLKCGARRKFIVFNLDDCKKYFTERHWDRLTELTRHIEMARRYIDKKTNEREYLVINTDEPYADEIIEILKRNGHWG